LADKGWDVGYIVFIVKPGFMPSLNQSFHRKIKEVTMRASLDAYATDDVSVRNARLVRQEEIMFEQWEVRRNGEKDLTQMDEDGDLKDQVRVRCTNSIS
jgi:chromosome condensin MukBEF MukE localization factor